MYIKIIIMVWFLIGQFFIENYHNINYTSSNVQNLLNVRYFEQDYIIIFKIHIR